MRINRLLQVDLSEKKDKVVWTNLFLEKGDSKEQIDIYICKILIMSCYINMHKKVAKIGIEIYFPFFLKKAFGTIVENIFLSEYEVKKIEMRVLNCEWFGIRILDSLGFEKEINFEGFYKINHVTYDYQIWSIYGE